MSGDVGTCSMCSAGETLARYRFADGVVICSGCIDAYMNVNRRPTDDQGPHCLWPECDGRPSAVQPCRECGSGTWKWLCPKCKSASCAEPRPPGLQSATALRDSGVQHHDHAGGVKHDSDKPDWTLLPWPALEEVVRVLEHGVKRYGRDNWRKVPEPERRYLAAAIRHITAVLGGELVDPDSKREHLAHAVCSLLFIIPRRTNEQDEATRT